MSIEVEVKTRTEKEIDYPCLVTYTDNNIVILMSEEKTGVSLTGSKVYEIGYYSDSWDMENIIPFKGELNLKNK